jgi:SH3-like domain-containing protein
MTNKTSHIAISVLLLLFLAVAGFWNVSQAADESSTFRSTVFPLPRFVSLSSDEVFARSGPGSRYPIKWIYHKKGLPVEVILEFETWRKIRDFEGETGWVSQSLISGKRTAIINGSEKVPLLQKPKENATKLAILEPRVVVSVDKCEPEWCRVSITGYQGWLKRSQIWGVYDKENID